MNSQTLGNSLCPSQPVDPSYDNVFITEGPIFYEWHLAYTNWQRRDKAARRYILSALIDALMLDVYELSTSHVIWEYLIATF